MISNYCNDCNYATIATICNDGYVQFATIATILLVALHPYIYNERDSILLL